MLRVCTSSTEDTLLSLEAYKVAIGTTSTGSDATFEAALKRATELVEGYVGYPLRRQVYYETLAGYGNNELSLSRVPVRSIESIYFDTELVDPLSYNIESEKAGTVFRETGWPWTAGVQYDLQPRIVPRSEIPSYKVTYEAGFCINGSTEDGWLTTGTPIPGDIEAAVAMAATFIAKSVGRDQTLLSKRIGDLSIEYQQTQSGVISTPSMGLPQDVKGMLSHWRRF